jgi:DNA-directed RNA polymerase specialized sigma24 family protein
MALRDWDLNESSFQRLLEFLDSDRQRAGERYERIRLKLTRFFEWKGCVPGEEFADETIDRVAKKLESGLAQQPGDPYLYFHGVAVNLVREKWRKAGREPQSVDDLPRSQEPAVSPFELQRRAHMERTTERRLACLADCLDRLPPASRELLIAYHLGAPRGRSRIGGRRGLAEHLDIAGSALRLRVFRIRRQMERCLGKCLGANETSGEISH